MSVKKIILDVKIDGANEQINVLNALQEELNALALQKKQLSEAEKELNKAIKDNTITEAEATQQAKDLAAQQVELNLITKESKKEYAEAEKALLNQGKAMDVNEGSIAAMRLELSKSQKEYINLSKAERENEQIGGVLQQRIKAQSDELKGLEKEIGITSRSVGDYGKAFESALPLMGGFGQQIQQVIGTLGEIKTALTAMRASMVTTTGATGGLSGALKVLKVALVSTGIGAIVLLLGSLVAAVLSTERGLDKLSSILVPLKEVFASLFGVLQRVGLKVFDSLAAAINNPRDAIKSLLQSFKDAAKGLNSILTNIKTLVVNSFVVLGLELKKALADVPLIGKGIDKAKLEKDLKVAKAAVLKAGKEIKDAVTPTDLINTTKEAYKRGQQIFELQEKIEDTEITLNREREKANRLIQEQREIIKDAESTEREKLTATREAIRLLDEITAKDKANLKDKHQLLVLEHQANDSREEGRKAENDALAEIEDLEADAIKQKLKLQKDANTIIKQNRAAEAKALEDQAKKVKEAEALALQESLNNEKARIEAQNKVFDEQAKLLQQERRLEELTTEETAEMKFQKEMELQKKLSDLKLKQVKLNAEMELKEEERKIDQLLQNGKISLEAANQQKEAAKKEEGEKIKAVELENLIAESELLRDERVRQNEINTEIEVKRQEKEEERKKAVVEGAFVAIDTTKKIIVDNQTRRVEDALKRELDALTLQRQQGLITEEQYNAKRLELEKEAFKKKQRIAIITALVDGGLTVAKTFATLGYPAGIIPAVLAGVQTAATVATIKAQKFQKGGIVEGKSHAEGGVAALVAGRELIELEGGEAIINKKATAKNLAQLSRINQEGGGVALADAKARLTPTVPTSGSLSKLAAFQGGGIAGGVSVTTQNINMDELAEMINTIKVVNVVSETANLTNREIEIKNLSTF